jgi:hypothetical protein
MGAEQLSRSPVVASWMVRSTRDIRAALVRSGREFAALRNSVLHNLHL